MKKIFSKENLAQVLKKCVCVMCCATFMQMVWTLIPSIAYCNDLFAEGEALISDAQQTLVNFAMALCPLSLIVIAILSMTTHNEKKLAGLMSFAKIVLVATILILVINSGVVVDTIKAWFE